MEESTPVSLPVNLGWIYCGFTVIRFLISQKILSSGTFPETSGSTIMVDLKSQNMIIPDYINRILDGLNDSCLRTIKKKLQENKDRGMDSQIHPVLQAGIFRTPEQ
jgi:hypothetical protein